MRTIPGLALGTYFAWKADGARNSANAREMQLLCWMVKNNRPTSPPGPALIAHPMHPASKPINVSIKTAPAYVGEIVGAHKIVASGSGGRRTS